MPVNPWSGFTQGLSSLDRTFETLTEQNRQKRLDELRAPYLRNQGELAALELGEKKRQIGRLRDYEQAQTAMESGFDTAHVPTAETVPNPDFQPGVPGAPQIYRPELTRTGERPLNEVEKTRQRIQLALKHGRYSDLQGIASVMDITDKMGDIGQLNRFATIMKNLKASMGTAGAKRMAPQVAQQLGIDPRIMANIDINDGGIIYTPTPDGGALAVVEMPDGTYKLQHITPKSPTEYSDWRAQFVAEHGRPPTAKEIEDRKRREGEPGAGIVTTPTPGILLDKNNMQYFTLGDDGRRTVLTSDAVREEALRFKEDMPADTIRVMQQTAPKVLNLVKSTRAVLEELKAVGPVTSRWRELWAGKVGTADPKFTTLRTNVGLLDTLLMRMHTGARGSVIIMEHFKDLIDAGRQSPENLESALAVIEVYARDVGKPRFGKGVDTPSPSSGEVKTAEDFLKKHRITK